MTSRRFTTTAAPAACGRVLIPVPFDPDAVWGVKPRHHVNGTVNLAQFYRRAYLRWIDGTKRRPDVRAQRIDELIQLLEAGHKQRPQP